MRSKDRETSGLTTSVEVVSLVAVELAGIAGQGDSETLAFVGKFDVFIISHGLVFASSIANAAADGHWARALDILVDELL